jgi:hypothetical protein
MQNVSSRRAALAFLLCCVLVAGCSSEKDCKVPAEGIILDSKPAANPKVQNGWAYDKGTIALDAATVLVVPEKARVERGSPDGQAEVFMEKWLAFMGHPPEPMSIRQARNHMGCACKQEGSKLLLATYGVWDSHIEGGTLMGLVIRVPNHLQVEKRAGLSGEKSAGQERHGQYIAKPPDVKDGYWYGPATPGPEWQAIPSVPDSEFTARGTAREQFDKD